MWQNSILITFKIIEISSQNTKHLCLTWLWQKKCIEITFRINLRKIISLDSINTFSFLYCSGWLNFIYFCKCLSCVPLLHKNIYFNLSIKKFVNLLKDYGRVIYKQIGVTERKKGKMLHLGPCAGLTTSETLRTVFGMGDQMKNLW